MLAKVPTRFWILLAVAWGIGAWRMLDRRASPPAESPALTPRPFAGEADAAFAPFPAAPMRSDDGREVVFDWPLEAQAFSDIRGLDLRVSAPEGEERWVQVLAECDHRFRFAHDIRFRGARDGDLLFRVDFDSGAGTWRAVDHEGRWSHLEVQGLRSLQVKVFSREPMAAAPTLDYRLHRCDEPGGIGSAWVEPLADPVHLGGRFELAFGFDRYGAPIFDPDAAGMAMHVTAPGGATAEVLPFVFQDFEASIGPEGERIVPRGAKHWRARFRPRTAGTHRYDLHIGTGGNRRSLASGTFDVTPGEPPAFLRVSPDNPRYFEDASGRFFYPIGWNLVYPVDVPYDIHYVDYLPEKNSLSTMLMFIDDLADSGGNFFRFWMTEWFAGIEWNRDIDQYGGIGSYNLKNAWIIDRILEHSRSRGVYILFETLNHVRLNPGFAGDAHPYLAAAGGFLNHLREFWTDPRAEEADMLRLRYIVARFADSPAIHSWNHMSEPDLVSRGVWPQAKALMFRQLERIREWDPYGRPLSNHINTHNRDFSFYEDPAIEFVHSNAYPGIHRLHEDQVFAVRRFSEVFSDHTQPILISEYGGHWAADPAEKMRRDIVGGLWAGVCSDLSGTPLNWWWNFTYGEELGREYRVVADFLHGEDLIAEDTEERGFWRNRPVSATSRDRNLHALMVGNRRRRWVYLFNFDTVCRSRLFATESVRNRVTFETMDDGEYAVEYWEPGVGRLAITDEVTVRNGRGVLRPPSLTHALVAKIVPVTKGEGEDAEAGEEEEISGGNAGGAEGVVREGEPGGAVAVRSRPWPEPRWRMEPLLPIRTAEAEPRTFIQCHIALPRDRFGAVPELVDAEGRSIEFFWDYLDDGGGWRITIPGGEKGPFLLSPGGAEGTPERPFDEMHVGLLLSISQQRERVLSTPQVFEAAFAARTNVEQIRADRIDMLENPFGANDHFLTKFEGPLLIPETGVYAFSLNSDDGSFLKINGEVVVEWLGNHTPEGGNKPLFNAWLRRQDMRLERGIHHLEYYHQESTGWQMARVGWRPADLAAESPIRPYVSASPVPAPADWGTLPPEYLRGFIPCSVELLDGETALGTVYPSAGLRLRRPGKEIFSLRWRAAGDPEAQTLWRSQSGRQDIHTPEGGVPVWVRNRTLQTFSLDWKQGRDGDGLPFIKTWLHDISLPLTFRIGTQRVSRLLAQREWELFPMAPQEAVGRFRFEIGGVPLLEGTADALPPPARMPGRIPLHASFDRLIIPTLPDGGASRQAIEFPRRFLARWYRGPWQGDHLLAERFPVDIWTRPPEALIAGVERRAGKTAVALVLDPRPSRLNIGQEDVERRLGDWTAALIEAEMLPLLVLAPDLDAGDPAQALQALAFIALRDRRNLPLVDLRFAREE